MGRKKLTKYKRKRSSKRSFKEIRKDMLKSLSKSEKNISQISEGSGINWQTVRRHLVYLIGMKYAEEMFHSSQVRVFKITEKGEEALNKNETI